MNTRIQSRVQRIVAGASVLKTLKAFKDSDVHILYGIRKAAEEILEALPQCAVCKKSQGGLITFGRGSGLEHLGKLCRPCAAAALNGETHQAPKARKASRSGEKKAGGDSALSEGLSVAGAKQKKAFDLGADEEARVRRVSETSGLGQEEALRIVSIMEEAAIPLLRDSMIKNVQQELKDEKDAETRFDADKIEVAVTEYYRIKGAERVGGDPNRPRRKPRR
ncbi:MAG: hypothetical protein EXS64_09960 [Candidatus Latescibacteria bacterium]|nr:hypothetical protein [Candidatus Latescibacterota bacterium]